MKIIENINREIIALYKSGESNKRVFLQTVKSLLLNKQKEKREELTEEEEIGVLKNELKKLQEAISQYKSGSREDLVQKTTKETEILKKYLPEMMSDEEVRTVVKRQVTCAEDKSFGNIMKTAMKELGGRADGSQVAKIVKEQITV